MPKFTSLLPDSGLSNQDSFIVPKVGEVLLTKNLGKCAICKDETRWIELSAHSHICSTECSERFWDGFSRAHEIADEDKPDDDPGF